MLQLRQSTVFVASTALASLALLMVLVNSWLILSNQSIRSDVGVRQQYINESIQLSRVNQELINALANAVGRNNNAAIRDLLAQSGITVTVTQQGQPPAQQPQAPAPAPAPGQTPAPAAGPRAGAAPEAPPDKPPLRK
ncbi:MAG TPA: hypothetical protein VMG55_19305 [Stellaceae bacterium]|nr:hypothetical protein [Stellaceae bacterium]